MAARGAAAERAEGVRHGEERRAALLPAARARIAKLKIAVKAPAGATITVVVDGASIPVANLGNDRPIDPGEHLVEASAPGTLPAKQRVALRDGEAIAMNLTLEPDPNAPASQATQPTSPPPPREGGDASTGGRSRVPAYILLGAGVVGVGVGATFGILAANKKSDLAVRRDIHVTGEAVARIEREHHRAELEEGNALLRTLPGPSERLVECDAALQVGDRKGQEADARFHGRS